MDLTKMMVQAEATIALQLRWFAQSPMTCLKRFSLHDPSATLVKRAWKEVRPVFGTGATRSGSDIQWSGSSYFDVRPIQTSINAPQVSVKAVKIKTPGQIKPNNNMANAAMTPATLTAQRMTTG